MTTQPDRHYDPTPNAQREADVQRMKQLMRDLLTQSQRTALIAQNADGLEVHEIAEAMDLPTYTVVGLLTSGKATLRAAMRRKEAA